MEPITFADTLKVIAINPPVTFFDYIKEPNSVIAIIAVLLSVTALILTVLYNRKTYQLTKIHNTLTVKPILVYSCNYHSGSIIFSIRNVGTGPGQINSLIFQHGDRTFKNISKVISFLQENGQDLTTPGIIGGFVNDTCLGCGQEMEFYKVKPTETNFKKTLKGFEGVTFHLKYTDIYANDFELHEDLVSSFE